MIYLTKGGKHLKKTLKAMGKVKRIVISHTDEKTILDKVCHYPDSHIVVVMDCTDASAVVQVLSDFLGGYKDILEDIVYDVSDKKRLTKDLKDNADEIFKKLDKKIEKAKEKCENTSDLRDKRGKFQDVIDGNASKSDVLKFHAKYCKIPKKSLKKLDRVPPIRDLTRDIGGKML